MIGSSTMSTVRSGAGNMLGCGDLLVDSLGELVSLVDDDELSLFDMLYELLMVSRPDAPSLSDGL